MITIHDNHTIVPEIHHSSNGRGWIKLRAKREMPAIGRFRSKELEDIEVTFFADDIAKLASDLSEELRENIAEMNMGI